MPELRRRDFLWAAGATGGASMIAGTWPASAHAQPGRPVETVTVFERGETPDYHTFRIPVVVQATDGTLLAFAEGRVTNAEDYGHSELVLKRSEDGGQTWGPLQVVAADGENKVANHVPVVDTITGRIHLFVVRTAGHVTGSDIVNDRVSPEDAPRPHMMYSDDHGATWSQWREITDDVKLPEMRHYVGGPVHGIQLTQGPHAGRLVIPGNHNFLPATDEHPAVVGIHVVYSDDHGETWQLGGALGEYDDGIVVPNETTVVELADGTLYFNTRNQRGTAPGNRAATTSSDGGVTFDGPWEIVSDLETPIVQGSLLEATRRTDSSERIVFSAPHHPSSRERMTLWSSTDSTATWRESLLVYDGPAGYSDLVPIGGDHSDTIGVLFENGPRLSAQEPLTYHQRISFAAVPLTALDGPIPRRRSTPDQSGNGIDAVVSGNLRRVAGVERRALELAGDYVEVPMSDAVDMANGPFTAALWFRTGDQRQQRIAHAYNYGGFPQWRIEVVPQSGALRAQVRTDSAGETIATSGNLADDEWHHVAIRWGSQGVLTLYLDGTPVARSSAISGSVSAAALAGIRFGARLDGINHPFVGALDEIYMYRRGLTHAEVASLAARQPFEDDYLVFHLPLDVLR